jgi:hypothetical protein
VIDTGANTITNAGVMKAESSSTLFNATRGFCSAVSIFPAKRARLLPSDSLPRSADEQHQRRS